MSYNHTATSKDTSEARAVPFNPLEVCENPGCTKQDTLGPVLLFKCSACHTRQYCSTKCQKECWKEHRRECPSLAAQHQRLGKQTPADKELSLYTSILTCSLETEMQIVSRSALRLNRPDSLSGTHHIGIEVTFQPPKTPIDSNDVVAVRKLFAFNGAGVRPDSEGDEHQKIQLKTMRELAAKKDNFDSAYFGIFVKTAAKNKFYVINKIAVWPARSQYETLYLNPFWKEFIRRCFLRDSYPRSRHEQIAKFTIEELQLYESPDYIEYYQNLVSKFSEDMANSELDEDELLRESRMVAKEQGSEAADQYIKRKMKEAAQRKDKA